MNSDYRKHLPLDKSAISPPLVKKNAKTPRWRMEIQPQPLIGFDYPPNCLYLPTFAKVLNSNFSTARVKYFARKAFKAQPEK